MKGLYEAKYRAIHADVTFWSISQNFDKLIYEEKPHLLTYQRKEPFEIILLLLHRLHEYLSYLSVQDKLLEDRDEWDLFYVKNSLKTLCPIFDNLDIKLRLNYICPKCKTQEHYTKIINYLKLALQKKKRFAK